MARHNTTSKAANFKDVKRANLRREQKIHRDCEAELNAIVEEERQQQKMEWAPVDKADAKHRQKVK